MAPLRICLLFSSKGFQKQAKREIFRLPIDNVFLKRVDILLFSLENIQ